MDFAAAEYEARLDRAQRAMAADGLDALFFTSEAEMRYFTGFRTLFWKSPTRPWFLVVPRTGGPIAIIPEIGAPLMRQNWCEDIRTWSAPNVDDDGVSPLVDCLSGFSTIGMMMGHETALRMPLGDYERMRDRLRNAAFHDCTRLVQHMRMVKSAAEIDLHKRICTIASDAFDRAEHLFAIGQPLDEAFRAFKIELLASGADDVPYLVGGKGPLGYGDVISPPDQTPIEPGDILMLDTGATLNGAFCDFDRNVAFGSVDPAVQRVHATLWDATEAGLKAARPGATCADLYQAMQGVIADASGNVGRFGHGLGMQLTEQPSIISWDETVLEPGMVMTLEPSMAVTPETMLVHEENIVITEDEPILLSRRESREMRILR